MAEFSSNRIARVIRLALDVLNGVPSIVVGIFAYALLVVGSGYAAWKGSVALAIVMLPVIARSTIEVLRLVPDSLRFGSLALGVSKWRTVVFVVMPSAIGSILTGRPCPSPVRQARRRRFCSRRRSSFPTRS